MNGAQSHPAADFTPGIDGGIQVQHLSPLWIEQLRNAQRSLNEENPTADAANLWVNKDVAKSLRRHLKHRHSANFL